MSQALLRFLMLGFPPVQFVDLLDSRKIHNEAITSIKFVPEKGWLISTSKDRTLKFWRFKQLKRINEGFNEVKNQAVLGVSVKGYRQKGDFDRDDPLHDQDEQEIDYRNDDYNQGQRDNGKTREPNKQKQVEIKKKEPDSDEDLTGWDA